MESQPQNPEFRNNPENFHPSKFSTKAHIYELKKTHWAIFNLT